MCNPKSKKQVGLHEVEAIDNQNMITIAVNPKEYFKNYKNKNINKKHNDTRKDASGMIFKSYARKIMSLRDHDSETIKTETNN